MKLSLFYLPTYWPQTNGSVAQLYDDILEEIEFIAFQRQEYDAFEVPMEQSRARFDEAHEIVLKTWEHLSGAARELRI